MRYCLVPDAFCPLHVLRLKGNALLSRALHVLRYIRSWQGSSQNCDGISGGLFRCLLEIFITQNTPMPAHSTPPPQILSYRSVCLSNCLMYTHTQLMLIHKHTHTYARVRAHGRPFVASSAPRCSSTIGPTCGFGWPSAASPTIACAIRTG